MAPSKTKPTTDDGATPQELPECFILMPISDPDGYASGHFKRVYQDLFVPACEAAGFRAVRADDVREANFIHEDLLRRLLNAPMALCDLSTRNPNVLFELGLRQAFDKPVVLVQEVNTPRIFDISLLRATDYRSGLLYREVLEDQKAISAVIEATQRASVEGRGINSLVRLLSLPQPATFKEVQDAEKDPVYQLIRAEINALREDFHRARQVQPRSIRSSSSMLSQIARLPSINAEIEAMNDLLSNPSPDIPDINEPGMQLRLGELTRLVERMVLEVVSPVEAAMVAETYGSIKELNRNFDEYMRRRYSVIVSPSS
jgi:hypothetical protein